MGEKKTADGSFDTCFENLSFAQTRDMMGKKGVGSLCEAFMKKAMKGQNGDWSTLCREMAQSCEGLQGQGAQEQKPEAEATPENQGHSTKADGETR